MQKARWSTAVAAAALLALPVATYAQSTPGTPQQNPPAQQQPPQQQQPPTSAPPTSPQPPSASPAGQSDANAAKTHLSQARDTLSQLTSMPEAAKLQGAARTQVSQLITDFNALITTQSEWRSAYGKVDADLTAVLGPDDAAPDQPVGTSGSAQLDPAIRAKLVEFRSHLKEFEKAAGGGAASPEPPASAAPSGSMPPGAPTPTTSNPANPASPSNPANPSNPVNPSSPVGTSGVTPASPTANMDPADRARAESAVNAAPNVNADAQKELDAISAILNGSKTGTLTRAQTTQVKKHVENLRLLLSKQ